MKKTLAAFLAMILVVSMVACSQAPAEQDDTTAPTGSSNATEGSNETTAGTETANPETRATEATEETSEPTANGATEPAETTEGQNPQPIAPHEHGYQSAVTKATCTDAGYTTYTCACGDTYVGNKIQAAGHEYSQWKTTKEPTATETGMKVRSCSACGYREQSTIGKVLSSHIHSYVTEVTPPTCASEGFTTYTCVCGESYTKDIVHKLPHDLTSTYTPNTCTEAGKSVYSCTKCSYVDERIWQPTGHDFRVYDHPASCENYGVRREQCINCAMNKPEIITPATGHNCDFREFKEATCTTAGTRTGVCKTCHKTVTEETSPPTGHVNTSKEVISTCSPFIKSCEKTICKTCDAVVSTVEKEPLPHKPTVTVTLGAACQTLCDQGHTFYITPDYSSVFYYDRCTQYTDWKVEACPECNFIFPETAYFAYTQQEAGEILLDYINEFRAQTFGTHAYDVTLSNYLMGRCNYNLNRGPEPEGNFYVNGLELMDEMALIDFSPNLKDQFQEWTEHTSIRSFLLNKDVKYFGFAYRQDAELDNKLPTRLMFAKDATSIG